MTPEELRELREMAEYHRLDPEALAYIQPVSFVYRYPRQIVFTPEAVLWMLDRIAELEEKNAQCDRDLVALDEELSRLNEEVV